LSLWKTLLLVTVVALAFLFARDYFEVVTLLAAVAWSVEYFRTRPTPGEEGSGRSVERLAELLGQKSRPFLTSLRLRVEGVPFNTTAFAVPAGGGELVVHDLACPTFRKTPLCFVVRPTRALVREAQLVENSRIPGIRFEYMLKRVEVPSPLEAACNMPDLFEELQRRADPWAWLGGSTNRGLSVQKVFFNGRVLHSHVVLGEGTTGGELMPFLAAQASFCLTLVELLDKVDFKVSV
jgi:hypothetical protein